MTVHAAVMNTSASTDCKDDGGISEVSEDSDTSQDAVATSAGIGARIGNQHMQGRASKAHCRCEGHSEFSNLIMICPSFPEILSLRQEFALTDNKNRQWSSEASDDALSPNYRKRHKISIKLWFASFKLICHVHIQWHIPDAVRPGLKAG